MNESNETKPSATTAKKRPSKPGRVRVMVSITDANAATLEKMAAEDSPVFPRPLNEYLSILIDRNFAAITASPEE